MRITIAVVAMAAVTLVAMSMVFGDNLLPFSCSAGSAGSAAPRPPRLPCPPRPPRPRVVDSARFLFVGWRFTEVPICASR